MKRLAIFISLCLIFSGCATSRSCPSVWNEPVSSCRAEVACGGGNTAAGMVLAGFNPTNRPNAAVDSYNTCVERNLSAQRANAGVHDNSQNCVSRKISEYEVRTECH